MPGPVDRDVLAEFEVLGGIEHPSLLLQAWDRIDHGLGWEARPVARYPSGDAVAVDRATSFVIGMPERIARERLDVEAIRIGTWAHIAAVVGPGLFDEANDAADHLRIKERAVSGQAQDDILADQRHRAIIEAAENIGLGPAPDVDVNFVAPFDDSVIRIKRRGGDPDLVDARRGARGTHTPFEHRMTAERHQDFTRQTRRAHPRLNYCNGFHGDT